MVLTLSTPIKKEGFNESEQNHSRTRRVSYGKFRNFLSYRKTVLLLSTHWADDKTHSYMEEFSLFELLHVGVQILYTLLSAPWADGRFFHRKITPYFLPLRK